MIKIKRNPCIVAVFDDDVALLDALQKARQRNLRILEVFTPFPVHGIEKILGIKRSNLGIAAFVFGTIGFLLSLTLQSYTMRFDWPVNIGGKPTWPLASFIPVLFELTVLIASLGLAFTFFWICGLLPGVIPVIYEPRATDDRFVVLFEKGTRENEVRDFLKHSGVLEMRDDEHITHNFPGPSPIKLR
ncbi:MAG: DUF3341 domain-containing protein [Bacteroidota bacterium]|nr:DUF3341 domain-containing protein [Bacteroidota bacterium]